MSSSRSYLKTYTCILCGVYAIGKRRQILIDMDLLRLVDYLDIFNKYPWGTLSYKKIIQFLNNCLVRRSQKFMERTNYEWHNLLGFSWAFQKWACDVIPSISVHFANYIDEKLVPRMLKWSSTKDPKSKTINDLLEDSEVNIFFFIYNNNICVFNDFCLI